MLELEVVKEHCRIEPDFTDDDSLLTLYIGAASRYVETWTRRKMYESETSEGYADNPDSILPGDDVKAAMLLLIGHWYANRESVNIGSITSEIPFATEALLQPYRIYGI
ncbi:MULTISPECIES: head-tail connector protein [Klebsiella pneumoniae complex]|uniref:head-tail connector protein n=1 Tax=Klebsiella pneumoniae complex TaxID=3390273 RepID=UPI00101CF7E1|nr:MULTISPECIES: head-tail connector protein [Klebsiella]HBX8260394.1 phage gp6-like head-tail connector protein [Klebsiella pneumoniae]HBZ7606299.1 phage gp6-like head-tail connector protein [Klebsiella pneumoniae]HCB0645165.1 phage gp6-like head-tail connector protein [Klebsiella variicola subsp. variicola]